MSSNITKQAGGQLWQTNKVSVKHFKRKVIFIHEKPTGLSIRIYASEMNDITIDEVSYR